MKNLHIPCLSFPPCSVGMMLFLCTPCSITMYTQGNSIITNVVIKLGCSKLYCLPNPY